MASAPRISQDSPGLPFHPRSSGASSSSTRRRRPQFSTPGEYLEAAERLPEHYLDAAEAYLSDNRFPVDEQVRRAEVCYREAVVRNAQGAVTAYYEFLRGQPDRLDSAAELLEDQALADPRYYASAANVRMENHQLDLAESNLRLGSEAGDDRAIRQLATFLNRQERPIEAGHHLRRSYFRTGEPSYLFESGIYYHVGDRPNLARTSFRDYGSWAEEHGNVADRDAATSALEMVDALNHTSPGLSV